MSEQQPAQRRSGGRLLAHVAVVIGVLAVTAAAFVLSYNAVRDIALAAGVTASLARLYPAILDAAFVVACVAAVTLRNARWWTRGYAWLSVLVTGALIGAADAYHAMGLRLPHKVAAGTVAALPVALVLLGFSLWLSVLRHARGGRPMTAPGPRAPAELGAGPALAIETGRPAPAGAVAAALPALPAPSTSLPPDTAGAPPVTESAPPVTESAPPVTESAPPVTEGAPPGRESIASETESASRAQSSPPAESAPLDMAGSSPAEGTPPGTAGSPPAESAPLDMPGSPAAEGTPPGENASSGTEGIPPAARGPAPVSASTPEPVTGPPAIQGPAATEPTAEPPTEALTPPYGFPAAASLDPAPMDAAPMDRAAESSSPPEEPAALAGHGPTQSAEHRTPAEARDPSEAPAYEAPADETPADEAPADEAPAPTFLSAPVPEVAEPDEPTRGHTGDARLLALAPEAVAARGKPPVPPAGRPEPTPRAGAAQAEADGPGHPVADAESGMTQEKGPGTAGPPVRFERVRSTPTPPRG